MAACLERIVDVNIKGSQGDEKVFVTIDRRMSRTKYRIPGSGQMAITSRNHSVVRRYLLSDANCSVVEQRDLVFMRERTRDVAADAGKEPGRVIKPQHEATISHVITPTAALLFRFSALTFNAHRIHLDKQYCSEIEGHRNLLVHGPLTVVLMLELLTRHLGREAPERKNDGENRLIEGIEYRNLAPLYAEEPMKVCGRPLEDGNWELWIEGRDGGLAVRATVKTVLALRPAFPKDPDELKEAEGAEEQAEAAEDVEEVEQAEQAEAAEDVEEVEQAEQAEDVEEAGQVEEIGKVEQAEDAGQQEQAEEEKREKQE